MNTTEPALCYELSLALALSTGAVPHQCYANAYHACEALSNWPTLCLIEGWMVLEQVGQVAVIEHAWCEGDDLILDPSLVLLGPWSLCQGARYIPGVRHKADALRALTCRDLPWVRTCGQFGPDGMGQPEYHAAYEAAKAFAMQLANIVSPAKAVVIQPCIAFHAEHKRRDLRVQIISSRAFLPRTGEEGEGTI